MELLTKAVEESREVRIEANPKGYIISSYQDKIGILQQVSWYMGDHCDGRHGYMSMSIRGKDGSEQGWLHIKLDEVDQLEILASSSPYEIVTINNTLKIYVKK